MTPMRGACYARYSSDLQRETSLDDQIGVAARYAAEHGWSVSPDAIYTDAAVSGASIEGRPGLQALLAATASAPPPFDVVLVDDSSRIARDLADALRTMQTLKFRGVRVIYISQGIDSASDQADALVTMHGLVDQLYLREMAKKIKRGLAGQLERGFVTGNRIYGYRTVGVPSGKSDVNGQPELLGKRRVIHDTEADVVRQIFELTARGVGVFTITRRLQERGPGPWGKPWTQGTIRRILRNEAYLGKLIWGRVSYERQPGTNKMVPRTQPRAEWKVTEVPDLRIVIDSVWQQVRAREQEIRAGLTNGNLARGRLPGYQSRHLLSGFLRCGDCGGSVAVVSSGKAAGPRYGCLRACREHSCTNRIETKVERIEQRLLERLQAELLKPEITNYIIRETSRRARQEPSGGTTPASVTAEIARERKKLHNLVAALEDGEPSAAIVQAIRNREENLRRMEGELALTRVPVPRCVVEPDTIRKELAELAGLLRGSAERARPVFKKLHLQVTLFPIHPDGERPYLKAIATCSLDALTGELPIVRRSLEEAAHS